MQGLTECEVWCLGDEQLGHLGNPILALAELSLAQIAAVGLHTESNEPPPRQASTTGWGAPKDERAMQAQAFAARVFFI